MVIDSYVDIDMVIDKDLDIVKCISQRKIFVVPTVSSKYTIQFWIR